MKQSSRIRIYIKFLHYILVSIHTYYVFITIHRSKICRKIVIIGIKGKKVPRVILTNKEDYGPAIIHEPENLLPIPAGTKNLRSEKF